MENATTITATPIVSAKPAAPGAPAKPAAKAPIAPKPEIDAGVTGGAKPQGSQPKPQAPAKSADRPRTIAELNEASRNGGASLSAAEKQRVKVASRLGAPSEAEIDAHLAKSESGKAGKPKPKAQTPADTGIETPVAPKPPKGPPAESKPVRPGIPDPFDDAGDETGEAGDGQVELEVDDDAGNEGSDELLNILGVQNRKDPKAAAEAAKFIKSRSDNFGQLTNEFKARGYQSPKEVFGALDAVSNTDAAVQDFLRRGPEGVAELFRVMQVPMPQGMLLGGAGGQQGAGQMGMPMQGAQGQQPQPQVPMDFAIPEGEFIDGKTFNALLPRLVQQITNQLHGQFTSQIKPLQERFDTIAPHLQNLAASSMQAQETSTAFRDVRTALSTISEINPEYSLTDTPENIWAESVGANGQVFGEHHPEWPKLAAILQERQEARKGGYPNLRAYLADRLMRRGAIPKLVNTQVTRGQLEQVRAKARRMQPGLDSGKKPGADATFVMPKNAEEMRALKRTNPQAAEEAKRRLKAGQFT